MALSKSVKLLRNETDIFSEPGYDISLASSEIVAYHPLTSTSNQNNPITFFIQGNDTQYLDFSESSLYLRCKIVCSDPKHTAKDMAPTNNFLHSLFKEVIVHLNETQITPHNNAYGHKAYIETVLSYGSDYKKSQAQAAMFYREKDPTKVTDKGVVARIERTHGGQTFELMGRLHVDFFAQTRYLIPGIDVRIQLTRNIDEFTIMYWGTDSVKFPVTIEEAKFTVMKHSLLPSILMNQLKIWQSGHPACYPMRRGELKNYSIPTGSLQHVNENILSGLLPDRVVVGLVNSQSYHGNLKSTTYNFGDHDLSSIFLTVNSDHQAVYKYELDKVNSKILESFYGLFSGMGIAECDDGIDMGLDEYINGRQLYVFDLRNMRDDFPMPRHGNIKLELKFKNGTASVLTSVIYADYPSTMYIDKTKNIYFRNFEKSK